MKLFKSSLLLLLIPVLGIISCNSRDQEWVTNSLQLNINEAGNITALVDPISKRNYLPTEVESPLLQIRINNEYFKPVSFQVGSESHCYVLGFENGSQARIRIEVKNEPYESEGYCKLTLLDLVSPDSVDLILWGPFPTIIGETIGETVGVVRDSSYAIGIQSLNIRTLGGYPTNESDIDPSYNIFETNSIVDIADSVKVFYRGQTAKRTEYGSVLQAYTRNRTSDRIISNWNHEYYEAPAYPDQGVRGSSIAIFGCPQDQALNYISKIEINENLAHPTMDGVWMKMSPLASSSYLIMGFGESNLDAAMDLTKQAGLRYLYHGGPFLNWGHFDLNKKDFPDNWESMKRCVERARSEGLFLGLHTLSNFITTNDAYVTPVPDQRLAKVGSSVITSSIGISDKSIAIQDPKFFDQMENNTLHAVVIGNEIIRYQSVSTIEPFMLQDCERGAFNTTASGHEQGSTISKLMDHGYRTFLTNAELSEEIAQRIADLYNYTGLQQISFDGLEGNWSTGLGQYGRQLFTQTWYDNLNPNLKGRVITDASNPGHFFWHIYTRMNWGEPWYAGFRESQTQYRLLNQLYFQRNLMPSMLGWFSMNSGTSLEDIEWLLARAAGFDAGFALVTSPEIIENHGLGDQLLAKIKLWETARLAGVFPISVKQDMQDISKEFHLEGPTYRDLNLYEASVWRGTFQNAAKQPGEPNILKIDFINENPDQPVQFLITGDSECDILNIRIELDNFRKILVPVDLPANHFLKYTGASYVDLYDQHWNLIKRGRVIQDNFTVIQGEHSITFEADFDSSKPASAMKIEFKTLTTPLELKQNEYPE